MSSPFLTVDGLVLREVRYKEADRILTILTADRGKLTVKAAGALRKTSLIAAATQQLTFSEFTLFENKGRITVKEAAVKESFEGLRKDFSAYALGCYFAEVTETLSREEAPEAAALQLTLNCLYALSKGLRPQKLVKAVFELRMMTVLGYMPDLSVCAVCGRQEPERPVFGIRSGHVCCRECRNDAMGVTDPLTPEALALMRYVVSAPAKQILARASEPASEPYFYKACEDFLLEQIDRNFRTLDYYRACV